MLGTSPSDGAAQVLCNIEPGGIVLSAIQKMGLRNVEYTYLKDLCCIALGGVLSTVPALFAVAKVASTHATSALSIPDCCRMPLSSLG